MLAGQAPMHLIWQDEGHVAFLSIRPNTPGFSVVVPRQHHGSYAFAQSDEVLSALMIAAKKVRSLWKYNHHHGREDFQVTICFL